MKSNKKILSLLNHGFKGSLLNNLNESQIDSLYKRLVENKKETKEQTQPGVTTTITSRKETKINPDALKNGVTLNGINLKNDGGQIVATQIEEDDDINITSDPDRSADGMGMFEEKELMEKFASQKQQKYFFAKCGDGKTKEQKKWCKMAEEFAEKTNFKKLPKTKKKEAKENFSMKDYTKKLGSAYTNIMKGKLQDMANENVNKKQLEKGIMSLVEKHITPKMTKRDLLSLVSEQGTKEKERTKEKEKTKSPGHDSPYQPKVKPAPKAGDTKTAPVKPKTPTKPGKPDYDTPYKPKVKPAPKAGNEELPNWLTFNSIGINLK